MPFDTRARAGQGAPAARAPQPPAQGGLQDPLMVQAAQSIAPQVAEQAKRQALLNTNKHGQGMAEELARTGTPGGGPNLFDGNTTGPAMSKALRDLVALTQYDSLKRKDVLLRAGEGSLSEAEKWTLAEVNGRMMQYIQPEMVINKIIPDSKVQSILTDGYMSDFGGPNNKVGGSVAHHLNYEQGLTGPESVPNFGLDYAAYTDTNGAGQRVEVEQGPAGFDGLKPTREKGPVPANLWHSEYVREDTQGGLTPVENVFYVQFQLPATQLANVKVPIHPSLISWATRKLFVLKNIGNLEAEMQAHFPGALGDELRASVAAKRATLEDFLAKVATNGPQVTRKLNGQGSNPQDPLTNLGMTRKGSRLTTEFGTINQEYYLAEFFELPEGSGLWLKDASGTDTQVGTLAATDAGELRWGQLNEDVMRAKLGENA